MRLRSEMIDLSGLDPVDEGDQPRAIGEIGVVEEEARVRIVWIPIQVIDSVGIERGGPADQAMYFIPLLKQEFCQVGAILAGDAGDQCGLVSSHFQHLSHDLGWVQRAPSEATAGQGYARRPLQRHPVHVASRLRGGGTIASSLDGGGRCEQARL